MHSVAHYITVFLLLLFSLNHISNCVLVGKQTTVTASTAGNLIETDEMKDSQDNKSKYEWLLAQRAWLPASMATITAKTGRHRYSSFWPNTLTAVLTPPPEIN